MGDFLLSLLYFSLTVSVVFLLKYLSSSSHPPYPPGPKPSLISGNSRELPTDLPWLKYGEWAKEYGDIVHVRAFNQHIVILNRVKDANTLFEKRSHIYSDRPEMAFIDLTGWNFSTGFIGYGDKWRRHRRLYQQGFSKKETKKMHEPVQIVKVHELLHRFLVSPQDFVAHIRNIVGEIAMATVYDKNISKSEEKRFITISERAIAQLTKSLVPGAMLVNVLPFLRYIPAWFPGAGFQTAAAETRAYTSQVIEVPFRYVKDRIAAGIQVSSFVERLLKQTNRALGSMAPLETDIKSVAATVFSGGTDTTVSAAGTFIYAMLIRPEVQRKAQDEIDNVLGRNRLPDYSDRPNLPYVEAVFREVMRWHPVAPLGLPHSTTVDDVYNGYFIPKGTSVIPNIWSMTHDESRYPEPDLFKPERFFDESGQLNNDDYILTFGFGRRLCPGRHIASSTIWLFISSVLATFNIQKARDEQGREINIDASYTSGMISYKLPYRCLIIPRSEETRKLIITTNIKVQCDDPIRESSSEALTDAIGST